MDKTLLYRYIFPDKEPPVLSDCPTNHTQGTDPGQPTAEVVWSGPTATDNSQEAVNVSCSPTSGSNFTMGVTEVVCTAEDSSGNTALCRFYVDIIGM